MACKFHCGTCAHSEPDTQDMGRVLCFGSPPCIVYKPIQVPGPDGKPRAAIAELLQRPSIPRGERACSLYQPKEFEVANEDAEPAGMVEGYSDGAESLPSGL